jgi:surface antigen
MRTTLSKLVATAAAAAMTTAIFVATSGAADAACSCSSTNPDLGSILHDGQYLHAGQYLRSPDGQYSLYLQTDGNLVEYNAAGVPLWDPPPPNQVVGHPGDWAVLQTDGNFVVYPASGSALWASYTTNSPGDYLALQDDGNLVIYSAGGSPLWATGDVTAFSVGSTRSSNLFPNGQCTWYAEQQARNYTGRWMNIWGNASAWASSAAAGGWDVGTYPRIGSVIVFAVGSDGAGGYGHVGWVTRVYPASHTVAFSEMNYLGLGVVDSRAITNGFGNPNIHYIYLNP